MCDVVFQFQGDVLKFAGDALWSYFPDDLDLGSFFGTVLEALDYVNSTEPLKGRTALQVHLGAEFGSFQLASLGDPKHRLEAEPIGDLLDVVYKACDLGDANQFVIGPALAQQCPGTEKLTPIDEKFSLVEAGSAPAGSENLMRAVGAETPATRSRNLELYVAQDVLKRIKSSGSSLAVQSEHRHVVVLFANFEHDFTGDADDPNGAINDLNDTLERCFAAIRRLHGSIARIDPYQRGHKLLVLFGAPTKREDDELSALQCATKLISFADAGFRIRIGLAIGPLYCGNVGSKKRREYTVMGEGVNLAARLMAKASWNEIIIDSALQSRLPAEVLTEPVFFALKGIGDNVTCHRFAGISEDTTTDESTEVIVGQQRALDALTVAWQETGGGWRRLVALTGEPGIGKSTLITSFIRRHSSANCVKVICKNSLLFGRGWLARKLLQQLYEQNHQGGGDIITFVESIVGARWLPIMTDLLEFDIQENAWTKGLTPELRIAKTRELFVELVSALVKSPQMIIVDDYDRADEYSHSLVLALGEVTDNLPLLLLVVTRDGDVFQPHPDQPALLSKVELEAPSDDE
ncbi:MAG: AAA family ATPase [candidate division Zixibacteria bacterium]|nr:AAA family ATPase [candidate division Zixibacteria bacterium]